MRQSILHVGLIILSAAFTAAAGAQSTSAAETGTAPNPQGIVLSVTGGPAFDLPDMAAHGSLAIGYAVGGLPLTFRASLMGVSWGNNVGYVSMTSSVVVAFGGATGFPRGLRPHALAGVGAYGIPLGVHAPGAFSRHYGAGLTHDRGRYALIGEVVRHVAYDRTFVGVGVSARR
jgi:hypothetical protein